VAHRKSGGQAEDQSGDASHRDRHDDEPGTIEDGDRRPTRSSPRQGCRPEGQFRDGKEACRGEWNRPHGHGVGQHRRLEHAEEQQEGDRDGGGAPGHHRQHQKRHADDRHATEKWGGITHPENGKQRQQGGEDEGAGRRDQALAYLA